MKVYIGKYRYHWNTQRMDKLWYRVRYGKEDWEVERKDWDRWDRAYEKFSDLCRDIICRPVNWIKNKIPRIHFIKIDDYDVWSADSTLAPIILPILKILQERKHGAPYTNDADVPDELKSVNAPPKESEYDVDEFHFKRWDYILGEMIFAFEQLVKDDMGEDQFRSGFADYMWQAFDADGNKVGEPQELHSRETNENVSHYQMVHGPRYTAVTDFAGMKAHNDRIDNGLRLFGTYYRALWD